jgi:uncharacterized membrane protein (UPF0127 family)
MRAYNLRNSNELANNVAVAESLLKRMKGLLGKSDMMPGEALWIKPCLSVHTFGMQFPIDIVFLDKKNKVAALIRNMHPNRLPRLNLRAASVLELPAGVLEATDTRIGDEIEIARGK